MSDRSLAKIASLRFAPYTLPYASPFRTAGGILRERKGWLLCVEDDGGAWGIGEAAPLQGFGMESHQAAGAALADWSRSLPGREIDLELVDGGSRTPAFGLAASHPSCPAASHGLELALLDLAARRSGLPLARILSPEAAAEVCCNATLSADAPEATAEHAQRLVRMGFETLKIKVLGENSREHAGENPDDALERLQAVRGAVGGEVKLRIDANGSWSEAQALPLLERLAPLHFEYVEQPLPPGELPGMARLAASSPIAIAADEAVVSMENAKDVLRMGAAQVLVLKPMALGGVLTALEVARLAAAEGAKVVITTMLEGAYGRAGAVHAAAALAALPGVAPYAHGLATGALLKEDLTGRPLAPEAGRIAVPQKPGLGLERPALLL
jgi:o-succinylbenzoate synthase